MVTVIMRLHVIAAIIITSLTDDGCCTVTTRYLGVKYDTLTICDSGVISFTPGHVCDNTPSKKVDFNGLIPFWASTTTSYEIGWRYYRDENFDLNFADATVTALWTTDPGPLGEATNAVLSNFASCAAGFEAKGLYTITWENMRPTFKGKCCTLHARDFWSLDYWTYFYYQYDMYYPYDHDHAIEAPPKNTYQVVFIHGKKDKDIYVQFIYNEIEWIEGDTGYVVVGMADGQGTRLAYPPYDGPDAGMLMYNSNIGRPGIYMYKISDKVPLGSQCQPLYNNPNGCMYPYGGANGDRKGPMDLNGVQLIDLSSSIKYLGVNYHKIYLNRNGIVGFLDDGFTNSYCLNAPKTDVDIQGFLPYWVNVGHGKILFRETKEATLLLMASDLVQEKVDPNCGSDLFEATSLFIVTWSRVRPYRYDTDTPPSKNLRNTFQVVLINGGPDKDAYVLFVYDRLEWSEAPSGKVVVGMSDGPGTRFAYPPYEGEDALQLTHDSNIDSDGCYLYKISDSILRNPQCRPLLSSECSLYPYGDLNVDILGPTHNDELFKVTLQNKFYDWWIFEHAYSTAEIGICENGYIYLDVELISENTCELPVDSFRPISPLVANNYVDILNTAGHDEDEIPPTSHIWYRETTDPALLERATADVYSEVKVDLYGNSMDDFRLAEWPLSYENNPHWFQATSLVIVTWSLMSPMIYTCTCCNDTGCCSGLDFVYNQDDGTYDYFFNNCGSIESVPAPLQNTYQVVIITGLHYGYLRQSYAFTIYDQIEWTGRHNSITSWDHDHRLLTESNIDRPGCYLKEIKTTMY